MVLYLNSILSSCSDFDKDQYLCISAKVLWLLHDQKAWSSLNFFPKLFDFLEAYSQYTLKDFFWGFNLLGKF